ncbi:hypothetical protein [Sphingomonas sp. PAMC 26621]|uniref:hypothetical protein n=1 Tax=Sphingomonas sp. PAMC 26621 TaxID=1112213 RepID=UPI0002892814|nr:hypothetical protein [Sphingomonas sp. PAMC 26621]
MVERVARALRARDETVVHFRGAEAPTWAQYLEDARSFLSTLRGPTEAMLEAVRPIPEHWLADGILDESRRAAILSCRIDVWSDWNDLLDAAIEEHIDPEPC